MGETRRWISNSMMRHALQVLEELLAHNGLTAALRLSGLERYIDDLPPDDDQMDIPRGDLNALFAAIVSMYGDQGARGVLRRWGRAFAVRRLKRRIALRVLRLGLRLIPAERSAPYVLARLLHHLDLASEDRPPTMEDSGASFLLELADCLYCPGQKPSQPYGNAVVGLVEGLLRWATGHDFEVTDQSSAGQGAVVLEIRKQPVGRR
ncbi:MAG TPA: hypothetical protein VFL17_09785 [Anaerolineae bacterium]|nr:hypothetical protein [Anaerolineae bacterium]